MPGNLHIHLQLQLAEIYEIMSSKIALFYIGCPPKKVHNFAYALLCTKTRYINECCLV